MEEDSETLPPGKTEEAETEAEAAEVVEEPAVDEASQE